MFMYLDSRSYSKLSVASFRETMYTVGLCYYSVAPVV